MGYARPRKRTNPQGRLRKSKERNSSCRGRDHSVDIRSTPSLPDGTATVSGSVLTVARTAPAQPDQIPSILPYRPSSTPLTSSRHQQHSPAQRAAFEVGHRLGYANAFRPWSRFTSTVPSPVQYHGSVQRRVLQGPGAFDTPSSGTARPYHVSEHAAYRGCGQGIHARHALFVGFGQTRTQVPSPRRTVGVGVCIGMQYRMVRL